MKPATAFVTGISPFVSLGHGITALFFKAITTINRSFACGPKRYLAPLTAFAASRVVHFGSTISASKASFAELSATPLVVSVETSHIYV